MKISIAGGMYEHSSRPVNYQRCVNLFPSPSGPDGESGSSDNFVLLHTPGLREVIDLAGLEVRAIMQYQGKMYCVVDDSFYELTATSSHDPEVVTITSTLRGTLNTQVGIVSWDSNATQLMIGDGGGGYIYTPADTTFTAISDADFLGAETLCLMDNYFIYNVPDTNKIYATAINDGSSVSALDFVSEQTKSGNVIAVTQFRNELWVFCELCTVVYYNAANPTGFPFTKRPGAAMDVGCLAVDSVVQIGNSHLIWLSHQGYIVKANGYDAETISTPAITKELVSYGKIEDAEAYGYDEDGHSFYVISFPSAQKTWVYDLFFNKWHERDYVVSGYHFRDIPRVCQKFQDINFVGAYNSGKIYTMSRKIHTHDGEYIQRLFVTPHQSQDKVLVGVPELELHMETGVGIETGQGSDPQIMMRYSVDGARTWSNELWRSIGAIGEYDARIRWNRLGVGRQWCFEFNYSEPTPCSFISLAVSIEGDGSA